MGLHCCKVCGKQQNSDNFYSHFPGAQAAELQISDEIEDDKNYASIKELNCPHEKYSATNDVTFNTSIKTTSDEKILKLDSIKNLVNPETPIEKIPSKREHSNKKNSTLHVSPSKSSILKRSETKAMPTVQTNKNEYEAKNTPEKAPAKTSEKVPEKAPAKTLEKVPEKALAKTSEKVPEKASGKAPVASKITFIRQNSNENKGKNKPKVASQLNKHDNLLESIRSAAVSRLEKKNIVIPLHSSPSDKNLGKKSQENNLDNTQDTPVSPIMSPRELSPRGIVPEPVYSDNKPFKNPPWGRITQSENFVLPEDPGDAIYLSYSISDSGSLHMRFAKSVDKISMRIIGTGKLQKMTPPAFKYKQATVLAKNIHKSSDAFFEGLAQFVRTCAKFQAPIQFYCLPPSFKPFVVAYRFKNDNLVFQTAGDDVISTEDCDAFAVICPKVLVNMNLTSTINLPTFSQAMIPEQNARLMFLD